MTGFGQIGRFAIRGVAHGLLLGEPCGVGRRVELFREKWKLKSSEPLCGVAGLVPDYCWAVPWGSGRDGRSVEECFAQDLNGIPGAARGGFMAGFLAEPNGDMAE